MAIWPINRLTSVCMATLALISLAHPAAQAQSRLTARYALSLANVTVGEGDWVVEINKDRYTAQSHGHFFGLWQKMFGGDIAATARGTASQGRLGPTGYEANFSSDDNVEEVHIAFRDGVVTEFEAKPPVRATPDRIPVSLAQLRGVVDPLTAGLVPALGSGEILMPANCRRTLSVFDGTHRFDVALAFKRMDFITIEGGRKEPAMVCAMTYRPLGGYRPGAFQVKYLTENHDMEMWFAAIPGTRLLAVISVSVPTMLGPATLKAIKFESASR
jgi:hypothetical protein